MGPTFWNRVLWVQPTSSRLNVYKPKSADGKPHREHWLVDEGAGEDGQLMAGCSLCDAIFQCRAQTVKSHENSSCHQKRGTAWMHKQENKADWQACFGKAAEHKARRKDS
eukprot:1157330-Pelagomonas_calceolata.AAC.9